MAMAPRTAGQDGPSPHRLKVVQRRRGQCARSTTEDRSSVSVRTLAPREIGAGGDSGLVRLSLYRDPFRVTGVAADERHGGEVRHVVRVPMLDELDDLVNERPRVKVRPLLLLDLDGVLPAVGAGDGGVGNVGAGDEAGFDEFASDAVEGVVGGAGDDDLDGVGGVGHVVSRG